MLCELNWQLSRKSLLVAYKSTYFIFSVHLKMKHLCYPVSAISCVITITCYNCKNYAINLGIICWVPSHTFLGRINLSVCNVDHLFTVYYMAIQVCIKKRYNIKQTVHIAVTTCLSWSSLLLINFKQSRHLAFPTRLS